MREGKRWQEDLRQTLTLTLSHRAREPQARLRCQTVTHILETSHPSRCLLNVVYYGVQLRMRRSAYSAQTMALATGRGHASESEGTSEG
jgi:hypothetical protein